MKLRNSKRRKPSCDAKAKESDSEDEVLFPIVEQFSPDTESISDSCSDGSFNDVQTDPKSSDLSKKLSLERAGLNQSENSAGDLELELIIDDAKIETVKEVLGRLSSDYAQQYCNYLRALQSQEESPLTPSQNQRETLICLICNKNFKKMSEKADHVKKHRDSNGRLKCGHCDMTYVEYHILSRHTKKKHLSADVHPCPDCKASFCTAESLRLHSKLHAKGGKESGFTCTLCGKKFSRANVFMEHISTHTGLKPLKCHLCGEKYRSLQCLKPHIKAHEGKNFECPQCDKKYASLKRLNDHVLNHSTDKKHECNVCGKKFKVRSTLAQHKLSHMSGRNFICGTCGFAFNNALQLRKHSKKKHMPSSGKDKEVDNLLPRVEKRPESMVKCSDSISNVLVGSGSNHDVCVADVNQQPLFLDKALGADSEVESDSEDS